MILDSYVVFDRAEAAATEDKNISRGDLLL
jgi:hypothetical protein